MRRSNLTIKMNGLHRGEAGLILAARCGPVVGLLLLSVFVQSTVAARPVCSSSPALESTQNDDKPYSCPMHPEETSASPGSCKKCGMTLMQAEVRRKVDHSIDASNFNLTNRIPDVTVYDQNGQRLRFYSDLVKGKTVAINFIFTTCTTICPPLTATMQKVQAGLNERVGRDIQLLSVTLDPVTDVPARLKAFGSKFNVGPGWTFVTGSKSDIDDLLQALGAYVGDKNNHSPMILIGNDAAGYWTRSYGLASPSRTIDLILDAARH